MADFVRTGRQSAFEEIVRRYAGMVYNTCLRVTKSRQDAEDATQAVFLTLALQVKKGTEIKALGPWLQQVAKRLALDTRRGGKRRRVREEQHQRDQTWRAECGESALPTTDLDEVKAILHEELGKLPSKYRLPLILHYFGGLSRDEMAAELNCNPSTLGVRIFRARALLAERLTTRGIDFTPAMLPLVMHQLVKGTISHAVIGATTRAAAAVAAGHNAAGLVSQRVIYLTRRAAAAALIGKLKVAALCAVVLCTLLAAGARALCTVPNLGLRDFLDRQVQSLVRPLLQPFALPGSLRLSRGPSTGFAPIATVWRSNGSAKPGPRLAAGWRFEPLVAGLCGDDAGLLTAIDVDHNDASVPDIFNEVGHGQPDTCTTDPAVAMADQDQSVSSALLDFENDTQAGGSGGDAGLDLPTSADDGSATAGVDAAAGGLGGGGASFTFNVPGATRTGAEQDPSDEFQASVGPHGIFSTMFHTAGTARGSSRGADATGTPSDPGNEAGPSKHAGGGPSGNGSRRPSRARPGARTTGSAWNLACPPPSGSAAALRLEPAGGSEKIYLPKLAMGEVDAGPPPLSSLPVTSLAASTLFSRWEDPAAAATPLGSAVLIGQRFNPLPLGAADFGCFEPLAATPAFSTATATLLTDRTPTSIGGVDPALESVPTVITPEPTGIVLMIGGGLVCTCRRRRARPVR